MTHQNLARKIAAVGFCLALLTGWMPTVAQTIPDADRRIALVIGISDYKNVQVLPNPVNDARAIGQSLRRLKFEVTEQYDGTFADLTKTIREFGNRAEKAEAAVIYYAGHGIQIGGENYLIPKDAKLKQETDLQYEAIRLEQLLNEVARASQVSIVLLDSCRDNPFSPQTAKPAALAGRSLSKSPGLARVDNVPHNTLVIMAAKANQVAEDGQDHSPFANALLAHFQYPGLELSVFFRSLRDTVLKATNNRQEPYSFSSLGADPFYFYPRPPNRPPEIGKITPLEVTEGANATPLGIPEPTDPDQDALTIRIVGIPQFGEVRIEGQALAVNTLLPSERLKKAVYQPDGKSRGPVGALDILIEDGRGGSVAASLPITVLPAKAQTVLAEVPAATPSPAKEPDRPPPEPNAQVAQPAMNLAISQRPILDFAQQQAAVTSALSSTRRLDFEAWVDRGDQTYRLGQPVMVSVRPRMDSYITVLNYGTSGRMTVVFPNQFQSDNRVRAGQTVEIPPTDAAFQLAATGPAGVELLQIIASDQPVSLPEVARIGMQAAAIPFVSFGRPAEEVAHDLVLQLNPLFGTIANSPVAVSKLLTLKVLPQEAGAYGQPTLMPITPSPLPGTDSVLSLPGSDGPLSIRTDKTIYRAGEAVQITVVAHRPCTLTLIESQSSGIISKLFPNPMQSAITLMPGEALLVPPPHAALQLVAGASSGIETIVGVCAQTDSATDPSLQQVFTRRDTLDRPRDLALAAAQPGVVAGQAAAAYFVIK